MYAETLGALDLLELVLYVDSVTDDTIKGVGTAIPAPTFEERVAIRANSLISGRKDK